VTTRRRPAADQPALDINVDAATPPAHPDEVVAREEISRHYDDRVTTARNTYEEAAAALAAAERARQAWRDRGEITSSSVHADPAHPHPEHLASEVQLASSATPRAATCKRPEPCSPPP